MSHARETTLTLFVIYLPPLTFGCPRFTFWLTFFKVLCYLYSSVDSSYHHIIIRFLINVQVQGQDPHQWAPFQIAGLLQAWQISHQISRYVYHEG